MSGVRTPTPAYNMNCLINLTLMLGYFKRKCVTAGGVTLGSVFNQSFLKQPNWKQTKLKQWYKVWFGWLVRQKMHLKEGNCFFKCLYFSIAVENLLRPKKLQ